MSFLLLTCQQLYESTQKPTINQISLKLLAEYYENYLNPYIFVYEVKIEETKEVKRLEVKFEKDKFCHLLGIEKTAKPAVRRDEIQNYAGEPGWNNIMNDLLDISSLKAINKAGFNKNKTRYVHFYLFPKIILNPKSVLYDKAKVSRDTTVECEIMFYNEYSTDIVHIGLSKYDDEDCYFPRTFFIEKISNNKDGKDFIRDQSKITVNQIKKEDIVIKI